MPNDVLTLHDYLIVIDPAKSADEREAAFQRRAIWLRGLGPADTLAQYYQAINNMVSDFGKLGVVEARPGIKGDEAFPPVILVESQPDLPEPCALRRGLLCLCGRGGAAADSQGAPPEVRDTTSRGWLGLRARW